MPFENFPHLRKMRNGIRDPRVKAAFIHLARNTHPSALNALEYHLERSLQREKPAHPPDQTSIDDLPIDTKFKGPLRRIGRTAFELSLRTPREITSTRGLGNVALEQIISALKEKNLTLADSTQVQFQIDHDVLELLRPKRRR